MTTTTANTTTTNTTADHLTAARAYTRPQRDHYAQRIARQRERGQSTLPARAQYASVYAVVITARRASRLRALTAQAGLEATLLEIVRKAHQRQPVGVAYRTIAAWADTAGLSRRAILPALKRLHAQGRIQYTCGDHRMDCGLWHPVIQRAPRDLGAVAYRINEIDQTHFQADTEINGCGIYGTGHTRQAAVQSLGRRLRACGFTGRLVAISSQDN
jgi:hypothetical protein